MGVLDFSAHILESQSKKEGFYDENGDWHDGKSEWIDVCKCDAVPNGRASTITLPDGTASSYSYTISNLPRDCKEFAYGDTIRIRFYGTKPQQFKVLGFHRYQHQCKLWV